MAIGLIFLYTKKLVAGANQTKLSLKARDNNKNKKELD
jgi:hypothetical protein